MSTQRLSHRNICDNISKIQFPKNKNFWSPTYFFIYLNTEYRQCCPLTQTDAWKHLLEATAESCDS